MNTRSTYNVTFTAEWGWIGTTVTATDHNDAIGVARAALADESGMPWEMLISMPFVDVDYVGIEVPA